MRMRKHDGNWGDVFTMLNEIYMGILSSCFLEYTYIVYLSVGKSYSRSESYFYEYEWTINMLMNYDDTL